MGYRRKLREAAHRKIQSSERGRGSTYSQCLKKRSYSSFRQAERVVKKVFDDRNVILRMYLCPLCEMYHLTKKRSGNATNTYKGA